MGYEVYGKDSRLFFELLAQWRAAAEQGKGLWIRAGPRGAVNIDGSITEAVQGSGYFIPALIHGKSVAISSEVSVAIPTPAPVVAPTPVFKDRTTGLGLIEVMLGMVGFGMLGALAWGIYMRNPQVFMSVMPWAGTALIGLAIAIALIYFGHHALAGREVPKVEVKEAEAPIAGYSIPLDELRSMVPRMLTGAFKSFNGDNDVPVIAVRGVGEEIRKELSSQLDMYGDDEFVAVAVERLEGSGPWYCVAIDTVGTIRSRLDHLTSDVTKHVALGMFEFLIDFKIYSSQQLLYVRHISIGKDSADASVAAGTETLRGRGIATMAIVKSIPQVVRHFGGMYIAMDTVEKLSSKGRAVGPALMQKYFGALQAGKLSPDDDRLTRFTQSPSGALDSARKKSVYIGRIPITMSPEAGLLNLGLLRGMAGVSAFGVIAFLAWGAYLRYPQAVLAAMPWLGVAAIAIGILTIYIGYKMTRVGSEARPIDEEIDRESEAPVVAARPEVSIVDSNTFIGGDEQRLVGVAGEMADVLKSGFQYSGAVEGFEAQDIADDLKQTGYILAVVDGKIAGFIRLSRLQEEIMLLCVSKDHASRGIGSALMDSAVEGLLNAKNGGYVLKIRATGGSRNFYESYFARRASMRDSRWHPENYLPDGVLFNVDIIPGPAPLSVEPAKPEIMIPVTFLFDENWRLEDKESFSEELLEAFNKACEGSRKEGSWEYRYNTGPAYDAAAHLYTTLPVALGDMLERKFGLAGLGNFYKTGSLDWFAIEGAKGEHMVTLFNQPFARISFSIDDNDIYIGPLFTETAAEAVRLKVIEIAKNSPYIRSLASQSIRGISEPAHFEAFELKALAGGRIRREVDADREKSLRPEMDRINVPGVVDESGSRIDAFQMTRAELDDIKKDLGFATDGEVGALLSKALSQLGRWGIPISEITSKKTLIALLDPDASRYMFEDCKENAFIGINRDFLDLAKRAMSVNNPGRARAIFISGIAHELRHEAGLVAEDFWLDAAFMNEIAKEYKLSISSLYTLSNYLVSEDFLRGLEVERSRDILYEMRPDFSGQSAIDVLKFEEHVKKLCLDQGINEYSRRTLNAFTVIPEIAKGMFDSVGAFMSAILLYRSPYMTGPLLGEYGNSVNIYIPGKTAFLLPLAMAVILLQLHFGGVYDLIRLAAAGVFILSTIASANVSLSWKDNLMHELMHAYIGLAALNLNDAALFDSEVEKALPFGEGKWLGPDEGILDVAASRVSVRAIEDVEEKIIEGLVLGIKSGAIIKRYPEHVKSLMRRSEDVSDQAGITQSMQTEPAPSIAKPENALKRTVRAIFRPPESRWIGTYYKTLEKLSTRGEAIFNMYTTTGGIRGLTTIGGIFPVTNEDLAQYPSLDKGLVNRAGSLISVSLGATDSFACAANASQIVNMDINAAVTDIIYPALGVLISREKDRIKIIARMMSRRVSILERWMLKYAPIQDVIDYLLKKPYDMALEDETVKLLTDAIKDNVSNLIVDIRPDDDTQAVMMKGISKERLIERVLKNYFNFFEYEQHQEYLRKFAGLAKGRLQPWFSTQGSIDHIRGLWNNN
ncbi:MAG TPA: GNAT family N-acetyltransferase, partial [Candidatus Omnitrophota bacterium]|nr:GNAT family N-acetyltransferase [Candidatus Omnitrophota bacterium]